MYRTIEGLFSELKNQVESAKKYIDNNEFKINLTIALYRGITPSETTQEAYASFLPEAKEEMQSRSKETKELYKSKVFDAYRNINTAAQYAHLILSKATPLAKTSTLQQQIQSMNNTVKQIDLAQKRAKVAVELFKQQPFAKVMEYLVFLQGALLFFPLVALVLSALMILVSFVFLKLFNRSMPPLTMYNLIRLYIIVLAGLEIYFLLSIALQALGFSLETRRYLFTFIAILFLILPQLYNYFVIKKKGY